MNLKSRDPRIRTKKKCKAILEGSKAFSKDLMKNMTSRPQRYENFDNADEALAYLETAKFPIVLKADGLALGKGVLICNTLEEAKSRRERDYAGQEIRCIR